MNIGTDILTEEVRPRRLFRRAFTLWWRAPVFELSAALSYYTLFAFAPMLVVIVSIAGVVLGSAEVQEALSRQINLFLGPQADTLILQAVQNAQATAGGDVITWIISTAVLLGSALGAFGELRNGFNTIWGLPQRVRGWREIVHRELFSFFAIVALGFLLILSLAASGILGILRTHFLPLFALSEPIFYLIYIVLPLCLTLALFALMFRLLPAVRVSWPSVLIGSLVTTTLFTIGRIVLTLYIAQSQTVSAYGVAGSLVALLLWVYYSGLIVYFGASVSRAFEERRRG